MAAGDVEGDDDAVALRQLRHLGADLHDLAHEFVADDVAVLHHRHEAVVDVEVGAADGGGGDLEDRIARMFDLRVVDGIDLHLRRAMVCNGAHRPPLCTELE